MKGFTLIETLIYAVLLSIVIGGVLFGVYQMLEARYRLNALVETQEESRFLMRKIIFAIDDFSEILEPGLDATSSAVSVNKINFASNPVSIYASGTKAFISYSGSGDEPLLSDSVFLNSLVFRHFENNGIPAIEISFLMEYRPREQISIYGAKTTLRTVMYSKR